MRRRASVEIGNVVTAALALPAETDDRADTRILDAAESLLRTRGLRRWSIEDAASQAGVGRTSVYRRFGDRDELVQAVLARELRRALHRISVAADGASGVETKIVVAIEAALRAFDDSVVDALLRSDPDTFLPYLTTGAGPLLAIARTAIVRQLSAYVPDPAPELAEALARVGLSFVLTRESTLPLGNRRRLHEAIRRMVQPFLAGLGVKD